MKGDEYYEFVELTEEEVKCAILEWKKRKFFYERSKEYWESLEQPKKAARKVSSGMENITKNG